MPHTATSPLPLPARAALDAAFRDGAAAFAALAAVSESASGRQGRLALADALAGTDEADGALRDALAAALATLPRETRDAVTEYAEWYGWTPADTACALLDDPAFPADALAWHTEGCS